MSSSLDTPSRRPRNRETRARIEQAAGVLFSSRGYATTSLQAVADTAGVHVQTIYQAYGTKAALLAACAARLVAGPEDPDTHPSRRAWSQAIQNTDELGHKLALYVEHIRDVAQRTTALLDVLRATAPSEPEVAAFLRHMESGRREGPLQLLGPLAGGSALRPELSPEDIADIVFALASPDTVRALRERGWPDSRVQSWLTETLLDSLTP